jgi:hypothetical protein
VLDTDAMVMALDVGGAASGVGRCVVVKCEVKRVVVNWR